MSIHLLLKTWLQQFLLASFLLALFTSVTAKTTNVWDDMEPFELLDLAGEKHQLSDWKGKVIMLNFWASWCSPCLHEIPVFVEYQKKYGDQGLQLVGIGVDVAPKLKNVRRTLGINYPTLVLDPDKSYQFMANWGDTDGFIPYTVVISRTGRVKYIHRGKLEREDFEEFVLPVILSKESDNTK